MTKLDSNKILEETFQVLCERNIIKMDKMTLKKKLFTQSTLLCAKEANDPLYVKYVRATKLRRACRQAIQEKYAAKGKIRMKQYLASQKGAKRREKSSSKEDK